MCAHPTRMLATHRDTHAHSTHAHTHAHGCVIRCTRNGGYKPHILILISKYRTFHPRFSEGNFVIMCASHSGHFRTEGLVSYTRMREKAEESDLRAPSRGWRRGREPRVGLRGPGAVALHCPPPDHAAPGRSPPVTAVDHVGEDAGHPEPRTQPMPSGRGQV